MTAAMVDKERAVVFWAMLKVRLSVQERPTTCAKLKNPSSAMSKLEAR